MKGTKGISDKVIPFIPFIPVGVSATFMEWYAYRNLW